jgi:rhodanese-related sulfurtransferase
MTWISLSIAIALLLVLLFLKRGHRISPKAASDYLRNGALVIDVRSAGEFTSGHLPKAVNIPLSEIDSVISRKVSDKNQVLLLHCQSGMRSKQAVTRLKALGYQNAFNLGSYRRAAEALSRQAE